MFKRSTKIRFGCYKGGHISLLTWYYPRLKGDYYKNILFNRFGLSSGARVRRMDGRCPRMNHISVTKLVYDRNTLATRSSFDFPLGISKALQGAIWSFGNFAKIWVSSTICAASNCWDFINLFDHPC